MVSVRGANTGVQTFAAASRQKGAIAPSPATRDDSGVNPMLIFPSLLVQVYDFELLCETSEPEGDGQYQNVCCPQTTCQHLILTLP